MTENKVQCNHSLGNGGECKNDKCPHWPLHMRILVESGSDGDSCEDKIQCYGFTDGLSPLVKTIVVSCVEVLL